MKIDFELHLTPKNALSFLIGVCVVGLAIIPLAVPVEHLTWLRWQITIGALAAMGVLSLFVQAIIQSGEEHNLGKKLDLLIAARGLSPDRLPQLLELTHPAGHDSGAHESPGIEGEVNRLALSPRTMSWELLRDVYRVSGRPEDATVDCDILLEVYLVNPSKNETKYVRDLRLSVEVNGRTVNLERQSDLRGIDISGKRYEYGLQMEKQGGHAEPIRELFSSLPFALSPAQAVEGWVRFMAKDINPDKIQENSWKLRVVDSLGVEHPITKVGSGSGKKGEIALRRVSG